VVPRIDCVSNQDYTCYMPDRKIDEPMTWEELERLYPRPELEIVPVEIVVEPPPPFIHPDAFITPKKIYRA